MSVGDVNFLQLNRMEERVLEKRDQIFVVNREGRFRSIDQGAFYDLSYLFERFIILIERVFEGAKVVDTATLHQIASAKRAFIEIQDQLTVSDPKKLLNGVRTYRGLASRMTGELSDVHNQVVAVLVKVANKCSTPEEAFLALAVRHEAGALFDGQQLNDISIAGDWSEVIQELATARDFHQKLVDLANRNATPQEAIFAMALREKASFCLNANELHDLSLGGLFVDFIRRQYDALEFRNVRVQLGKVQRCSSKLAETKKRLEVWQSDLAKAKTPDEMARVKHYVALNEEKVGQQMRALQQAQRELADAMDQSSQEVKGSSAYQELATVAGLVERCGTSQVRDRWIGSGATTLSLYLDPLSNGLDAAFSESKRLLKAAAEVHAILINELQGLATREEAQKLEVRYPEEPRNEVAIPKRHADGGWWSSLFGGGEEKEPSPLHSMARWAERHGLGPLLNGRAMAQLRLIGADLHLRVAPGGFRPEEILDEYTALYGSAGFERKRGGQLTGQELLQVVNDAIQDVDRALDLVRSTSVMSNFDARRELVEGQKGKQKELLQAAEADCVRNPGVFHYQTLVTTTKARIAELDRELERLSKPQVSDQERRLELLKEWLEKARDQAVHIVEFTTQITEISESRQSLSIQKGELRVRQDVALEIVPQSDGLMSDLGQIRQMLTLDSVKA